MKELDWNHLRAFQATAATGSLSAAANQLGLTQPTLSRQVKALETNLDVILFERRGRRLFLTHKGHELLVHIGSMRDAADTIALAANGQTQEISGRVCLSATDTIASYVLPNIVDKIRSAAPQLVIEILATNSISDLHRMEADIAIRHATPDRAGLVGNHICDSEAYFYASEDWVRQNGLPTTMAELAKTHLIGFDDTERLSSHFRNIGIPVFATDFRLVSSSAVVVWEMVKRGLGVAAMLNEVAALTPGIVKLLPDVAPTRVPLWLVSHEALRASPRIKLVERIITKALRSPQTLGQTGLGRR